MIRAAAAALLVLAAPARADAPPPVKKDLAARAKSAHHAAPTLVAGAKPAKLVNLYNQWTHEWLAVDPAAPPRPTTVDHFLRDHYTNHATAMDPHLIGFVVAAAAHFHADAATVVSGFRHPKYNLILRKKGHQVARDSQHTHGHAIDFFLPSVPAAQLEAWARAQKLGGVGVYPESGFVHMDTGPVRTWSGE